MKIWAKVMNADRILRDVVYEGDHKFTPSGFRDAVQNASYLLDVSTPSSFCLPTLSRTWDLPLTYLNS